MSYLTDGFPTTVTFADYPSVLLSVISLTPMGISGGGKVDQTTMAATRYRTSTPKKLIELTPLSGKFAYDPVALETLLGMVNDNQLITVGFSDGSSLAAWGFVNEAKPSELSEGNKPTIDLTIEFTCRNASGTETAPDYTADTTTG